MVGVGAGLANGGRIPFVSAASCFLTGRALEQVKADIAYAKFNVKLVGQSVGIAYGELGATHHSIEDFAWLRPLARSPSSSPPTPGRPPRRSDGPPRMRARSIIRLSRMPVPDLDVADRAFRARHGRAGARRART